MWWGKMGEGYIFAPLFGCLLIIKYMLYVLLFDVLFDLGVRQFVFLRLSSKEIIKAGIFISTFISAPSLSETS